MTDLSVPGQWLTERNGWPPHLADFECQHGNLFEDQERKCACWDKFRKPEKA